MQLLSSRMKKVIDEKEIVSLACEMIAIPSYRGVKKQETAMAACIDHFF